ncbi:cbb3-type cytochrome c oxidase N-terminal domain-containing protein [Blattabacterium cuenoti]|uniref:cbb3-type cytochrome c oxidase N-terminal domain-containing protein n=1 Tax=Blattabacterium cuenoti TaxID=1653831 RepID=UPI00163B6A40|nr:cbb3-type cytochrome c oxidase N-terminal domain-containing protein [Blattabacterium cuenoti]
MNRYKIPYFIIIPFILSVIWFIFYTFLKSYDHINYITHPITIYFFLINTILLIVLESINNLIFKIRLKSFSYKERKNILEKKEGNYFYSLYKFIFFDPKKINKEIKKIDHGFDVIIELDNKLPIWWIHLFYTTFIFSSIYFFSYLFMDFSNPYKEYDISYRKQLKEIEIFEKNVPQATIENSIFKKYLVNDGKLLFKENCATCHKSDGSGNIGPNLTDEYWINKVEKDLYKNIFYIIWNGSEKNPAMRPFGKSKEIKGNDIEKISSYVYFINRIDKKPLIHKSPQGEKILEWSKGI